MIRRTCSLKSERPTDSNRLPFLPFGNRKHRTLIGKNGCHRQREECAKPIAHAVFAPWVRNVSKCLWQGNKWKGKCFARA